MPLPSTRLFVFRIFLLVVVPIAFSLSASAQTVSRIESRARFATGLTRRSMEDR